MKKKILTKSEQYKRNYAKTHYKNPGLKIPNEVFEKAREEILKEYKSFNNFIVIKLKEMIKNED